MLDGADYQQTELGLAVGDLITALRSRGEFDGHAAERILAALEKLGRDSASKEVFPKSVAGDVFSAMYFTNGVLPRIKPRPGLKEKFADFFRDLLEVVLRISLPPIPKDEAQTHAQLHSTDAELGPAVKFLVQRLKTEATFDAPAANVILSYLESLGREATDAFPKFVTGDLLYLISSLDEIASNLGSESSADADVGGFYAKLQDVIEQISV
jgi:hypothetical protein